MGETAFNPPALVAALDQLRVKKTAYEVFDSTTVPDPSNGGCLWTEAFRLHPAIVCAEICGAGRCHGPS